MKAAPTSPTPGANFYPCPDRQSIHTRLLTDKTKCFFDLHGIKLPLPAGCRLIPPKNGSQVLLRRTLRERLLGKGLMPDSSMAEHPTVNRRVVGSTPTLAVSFVRVVGISAVQRAFNPQR